MSKTAHRALVRAAAGTGKTVRLTQRYLELLSEGVQVEQIIAITFTRRAAAELKERISDVLLALLANGGARSKRARVSLGNELDDCYRQVAPSDQNVIRRALSGLGAAPMGTIDSFVQRLLSEFALDAFLPGPDGQNIPLDFPIDQSGDASKVFVDAARQVLHPDHETPLPPEASRLLAHFSVSELVALCMRRMPTQSPALATASDTFGALAQQLVHQLSLQRPNDDLRTLLRRLLWLTPDLARLEQGIQDNVGARGKPTAPEIAEWLRTGEEAAPPESLTLMWKNLSTAKDSIGLPLAPFGAATPADRLVYFIDKCGLTDPLSVMRRLFQLPESQSTWEADLSNGVNKPGLQHVQTVLDWLTQPNPSGESAPPALIPLMNQVSKKTWKAASLDAKVWKGFEDTAMDICKRIRERASVESALVFIRESFEPTIDPKDWGFHLARRANKPGKPLALAVATWLSATEERPPPAELVGYLGSLESKTHKAVFTPFFGSDENEMPSKEVVFDVAVGGGSVRVALSKLANGFPSRSLVKADFIDGLRTDLHTLQKATNQIALEQIAREGRLDYDDLLNAAVQLCHTAAANDAHPLRSRFSALLVDEVQDSSPEQVCFYESLLALRPDIAAFFVGDVRQSIYLFRGAEPNGIHRIAELCEDTTEALLDNWRSVGELVAAQRSLFDDRLADTMEQQYLEPLESLTELKSGKGDAGLGAPPVKLILPPNDVQVPPVSANLCALREFANTIQTEWTSMLATHGTDHAIPEDKRPTAVVLAPTWRTAIMACDVLRSWLGQDAVHLDGGGRWRESRVVRDLRIVLAALTDRGNQLAWLGLWKLPMVGLSDSALALMRQGEGFVSESEDEAPWLRYLGWSVEATGLCPKVHTPRDVAAFTRARSAIRDAARDLGHRPSAEVIERLATNLRWRELLSVSPQDDALAHLDLALEWVRSLDEAGQPATEILKQLDAQQGASDIPRLELTRPPLHISCTTVFQAKGLQWDHVCVMTVGAGPKGGGAKQGPPQVQPKATTLGIATAGVPERTFHLQAISVDLDGAFDTKVDVIGHLDNVIDARRKLSEELRLAYVAITRATRSVTFGLPNHLSQGVQKQLLAAWDRAEDVETPPLVGVELIPWYEPNLDHTDTMAHVKPDESWAAPPAPPKAWNKQAPSGLGSALNKHARLEMAETVAARILDGGTWDTSTTEFVTRETLPDERIGPDVLGNIVHGWFAVWAFKSTITIENITAYLADDWTQISDLHRPLSVIILEICTKLAQHNTSPLWQLVTREDVELYFEMPLLGLSSIGDPHDPFLMGGRIDLLVRDPTAPPHERWTIVDFKAGGHHPVKPKDNSREAATNELIREAKLRSYGTQLEAYREAVNDVLAARKCDEAVGKTALWFVRKGSSVIW